MGSFAKRMCSTNPAHPCCFRESLGRGFADSKVVHRQACGKSKTTVLIRWKMPRGIQWCASCAQESAGYTATRIGSCLLSVRQQCQVRHVASILLLRSLIDLPAEAIRFSTSDPALLCRGLCRNSIRISCSFSDSFQATRKQVACSRDDSSASWGPSIGTVVVSNARLGFRGQR